MRYILKRILESSFPGSLDVGYVELTSKEWEEVHDRFTGRWKDTKEEL